MESNNRNGVIYTAETKKMRMENPVTLKVGQVFTGFGIGCGVGIGVGRPLNLGAIPVLNEVMVATRGATDAFSGVQRHVNDALRKVGAKSIEAGIGCGVGFGHGFGAGIAVRPSVLLQFQSHVSQAVTSIVKKLGMGPTLSANQHLLPPSMLTAMDIVKEPSPENTDGSISQLVKSMSKSTSKGNIGKTKVSSGNTAVPNDSATNIQYSSRTERVIENFLNSPILKDDGSSAKEQDGRQHLENNMLLQMVLKHQVLIEELMQENEKLRDVLVKELKVQPNKFESSFSRSTRSSSCSECFECRRKQRKR